VAHIRMVLDMEVQAGNQTAPLFAQPELWAFLDGLAERDRPCPASTISSDGRQLFLRVVLPQLRMLPKS
jgi:hypothetical protein